MLGAINRSVRGIEIDNETLAVNTIEDVCLHGPEHFLSHTSTLSRMQKDYVYPEVGNRFPPDLWKEMGSIASMGMQSTAGKKIRIQRRTAMLTDDNGSAQIVVTLKSGGILTFNSDSVSGDDLLAFAKEFPVADLDDSLG